jgi:hypothetical protein
LGGSASARLAEEIAMNDATPYGTPSLDWMATFLAGALTGASVALLLLPQSGRTARQRARGKLEGPAEAARQLEESLVRRGQALLDEAHHRVEGAATALYGDGELKQPV